MAAFVSNDADLRAEMQNLKDSDGLVEALIGGHVP
jgi:hypothetical protein